MQGMSIVSIREMATSVSGSVFSYSGCLAKRAVSSPPNGSKSKLQVQDAIHLRVIFRCGRGKILTVICSVVIFAGFG